MRSQRVFKKNIGSFSIAALFCCAVLFGATIIPKGAYASISQPVNNWEVSSIDGIGGSSSSYCVAANAFDDRTIMIIAYENGKQSSIAFNIQDKKFKPKENYALTMEFSNGSIGQFNGTAENESTLIVQAGSDLTLWRNLVSSGSLKISVLDVRREYSLRQFDFIYSSLNECVGENLRAEDLQKKPVPATQFSAVESKILQRHENNLPSAQRLDDSFLVDALAVEMPKGLGANKSPSSPVISRSDVHPSVNYVLSLLKQSAVQVQSADANPIVENDYFRYAWTTEQGLQGKFEQVYWPNEKSFYDLTKNYLDRNGLSCGADFMPMTNEAYRVGDIAIADGQAFCMSTASNTSVSYLFFGIGNTFSTIEHKGRFDQLETALLVRENIRQALEFIATGRTPQLNKTQSDMLTLPELPSEIYSQ